MIRFRPRSIVSLILVGFAVVLTPFVIAVVTAVVQVDRLSFESRSAVLNAGSAVEDSATLVEQITGMQRALGQYAVRGDRDFFEIYLNRRSEFREALSNLIDLNPPGIDTARLLSLDADEISVFQRVSAPGARDQSGNWETAIDSLASLAGRARDVLAESDRLVQDNANRLNARAESLQRTLLVIAAAAAPTTVVLVVFFTALITRPMRELGGAIRRLGAREFDQPIVVGGPLDIEALAEELEWLRRRISSLEEQKTAFIQHISHELKTPLTTIREGSELLTESLRDEGSEEAEIARLLQKSGLHLQQLIEDLLQFAKTQDLAIDLEFETAVDLSILIDECVAGLAVVIDAKEVEIETRLEQLSARCDRSKIGTVLNNLLTNAIKYTPEGGRIGIDLAADSDYAQIDITDSGPGVAEEDRTKIFEPFKQGSAKYESSVKGTGLGLSIAREYVVAHGGSIELIENEGGAHFRVALPIAGPGNLID
jgi:two-component system sensor histidine kinase GlrK